jgi:hypothetical protein
MNFYKGLTFNSKGDIILGAPGGNGVPAINGVLVPNGAQVVTDMGDIVVTPDMNPLTFSWVINFRATAADVAELPYLWKPYQVYFEFEDSVSHPELGHTGRLGSKVRAETGSLRYFFTSDAPNYPNSWITWGDVAGDVKGDNADPNLFEDFTQYGSYPIRVRAGDYTGPYGLQGYLGGNTENFFWTNENIVNDNNLQPVGGNISWGGVCEGSEEAYHLAGNPAGTGNTLTSRIRYQVAALTDPRITPTGNEMGAGEGINFQLGLNLSTTGGGGSGGVAVMQFSLLNIPGA